MTTYAGVRDGFREKFGREARVFRAPGRVNLIGEHTDYNDGWVLPAAIDFFTWVGIAPRGDRIVHLYSENFDESFEFSLDEANPKPRSHWSDYPRGVALQLLGAGHVLRGADLWIRGEVPIGSGLSSSAAIEVSTGLALLGVAGIAVEKMDLARLCQRAENEFAGARSGLMDQFISSHAVAGKVMLFDCRSLTFEPYALPAGLALVICNTNVKHALAGGEYNVRRRECEQAVALLSQEVSGIQALRDVTPEMLDAHQNMLPETIRKRCRHVVSENARVLAMTQALKKLDLDEIGALIRESHRSLRQDYEVSCRELDILADFGNSHAGVVGSRMTGGGFGGCTVNLVQAEQVDTFRSDVVQHYRAATGRAAEIYVTSIPDGAREITA